MTRSPSASPRRRALRACGASLALASILSASSGCAPAPTDAESAIVGEELGAASKLPAVCAAPVVNDCSFYAACIEATVPCGPSGYALGYGTKYCARFRDNDALSERGRAWRDEVMVCLQRRLGRFLTPPLRDRATCEDVIDGAFDDHPACYTQPSASICDLPPTDWLSIVWTIDAADLLSKRGRVQIGETARICVERWARALFPFASSSSPRAHDDELAAIHPANEASRPLVEALASNPLLDLAEVQELARRGATSAARAPEGRDEASRPPQEQTFRSF